MSVFDRFLSLMKLNDDDNLDEEAYLDEETDEGFDEEEGRTRLIRRSRDEEDDLDEDIPASQALAPPAQAREREPREGRTGRTASASSSSASRSRGTARVSNMRSRKTAGSTAPASAQVCIIRPRSIEDGSKITDTLLENCTVILNLEGLDLEIGQRIIDYTAGSCYAMNGNLQKISNYIFVITPSSVDISGDFQEVLTGAFDVATF